MFFHKAFHVKAWLMQVLPEQVIPTSCWRVQLCFPHPSCLQSQRADSFPRQETWSIQMRPEPALELAHPVALTTVGHPSCLQTTETAAKSQPLLHTVPHSSWTFTSTLPEHLFSPAVSLSSLSVPPVTIGKGSNRSRSKEQVENYCSWLLIYFSKPDSRNISGPIHGTTGECYFIQYLRLQIKQWHKPSKSG